MQEDLTNNVAARPQQEQLDENVILDPLQELIDRGMENLKRIASEDIRPVSKSVRNIGIRLQKKS